MDLYGHAGQLLEAALAAARAGGNEEGWTVFVGPEGGWQMIAGAEHEPAALAWSRGARAVWKVSRAGTSIRVEGWAEGQHCLLEAAAPGRAVCALIGEQRLYAAA
ncbi:MAG: hypothetical protein NZR01_14155 [Bryobacteraceae bacterium]|nr:hypothetical protein [Bryobacteraceae bacterium]